MTYLGNIVYNSQRSELRKIVLNCQIIDLEFQVSNLIYTKIQLV